MEKDRVDVQNSSDDSPVHDGYRHGSVVDKYEVRAPEFERGVIG